MGKEPDRIYIDSEDRRRYETLSETEGMFADANLENKDLFFYAMAYGVSCGAKRPLKTRDGYFRVDYMKPEDEALLGALAFSESENSEIAIDKSSLYAIAEQYAHAGIMLLLEKVEQVEFGSFGGIVEREILERLQEIKRK